MLYLSQQTAGPPVPVALSKHFLASSVLSVADSASTTCTGIDVLIPWWFCDVLKL